MYAMRSCVAVTVLEPVTPLPAVRVRVAPLNVRPGYAPASVNK